MQVRARLIKTTPCNESGQRRTVPYPAGGALVFASSQQKDNRRRQPVGGPGLFQWRGVCLRPTARISRRHLCCVPEERRAAWMLSEREPSVAARPSGALCVEGGGGRMSG